MTAATHIVTGQNSGLKNPWARGIAAHGIFLAAALAYLLAFLIVGLLVPVVGGMALFELVLAILVFSWPTIFAALCLCLFADMLRHERPAHPIAALAGRIKALFSDRARLAAALPMLAGLSLFMISFTAFKAAIPQIAPFSWDATFDSWDTSLHAGYRPWELLAPVFHSPFLTVTLNGNYHFWFITMNLFWAHYVFIAPPGEERTRFFLAFMLTMILTGTVLATAFASVGPCYFDKLGLGYNPYADLMARLREISLSYPLLSVGTQDLLWRYHTEASPFGGVSAMPSVHNATALLFVLAVWRKHVLLRLLTIAHAALIFLGSIVLGWHYAVDSYLAWPLALACWWLAGALACWWEARPHVGQFNSLFTTGH